MRLDKWLWHARFFKTRSLATTYIEKARCRIDGRVTDKPHAAVAPGMEIHWDWLVAGLGLEQLEITTPLERLTQHHGRPVGDIALERIEQCDEAAAPLERGAAHAPSRE